MELRERMRLLDSIYRKRNRLYMPELRDRMEFLIVTAGRLRKKVRQRAEGEYGPAVARLLAACFSIAEYDELGRNDFIAQLCRKYPRAGCSYCQNLVCGCRTDLRPPPTLSPATEEQKRWGIARWLEHLQEVYGRANRERGLQDTLGRLFEEVAELQMAAVELREDPEGARVGFALELADVFVWTLAVADLLEVDADQAMAQYYTFNRCPACRAAECQCTPENVIMRWKA